MGDCRYGQRLKTLFRKSVLCRTGRIALNRNRLARAGVIVIDTWLYFSGLIPLLGAVINTVLGGDASDKSGGVGQGAAEDGTTRAGDETRYEGQ